MSVELPTREGRCVVVVDGHWHEVEQLGHLMSRLQDNTGWMLTYRRLEDLLHSPPPDGRVGMVVLATDDPPQVVTRALHWLRYRYARCAMVVVGSEGCGEHELAARIGGASYLTRPVHSGQWEGLLSHALGPRANLGRKEPAGH